MQSPGTWSLRWTGSGDPWHPRSPCLPWCSPSSQRCIARRHWLQIHFQMVSASWYWVWHPRHPWLVLSIICWGENMNKISLVQVDKGKRDINCLTLRCKVSLSLLPTTHSARDRAAAMDRFKEKWASSRRLQSSSSYQQLMELSKVHDMNTDIRCSSLIMHNNGSRCYHNSWTFRDRFYICVQMLVVHTYLHWSYCQLL